MLQIYFLLLCSVKDTALVEVVQNKGIKTSPQQARTLRNRVEYSSRRIDLANSQ